MGLLQREIEKLGIRTASLTHIPEITQKMNTPRYMVTPYPMGLTFDYAYQHEAQKYILKRVIEFAAYGKHREVLDVNDWAEL